MLGGRGRESKRARKLYPLLMIVLVYGERDLMWPSRSSACVIDKDRFSHCAT